MEELLCVCVGGGCNYHCELEGGGGDGKERKQIHTPPASLSIWPSVKAVW